MNTLIVSVWDINSYYYDSHAKVRDAIQNGNIDRVIFLVQYEWGHELDNRFKYLAEYTFEQSIPMIVVASTHPSLGIQHDTKFTNIEMANWYTYWLSSTWADSDAFLRHHTVRPAPYTETFLYPFISMNNRAKEHRCMVMDKMCEYDLLRLGAVSWRDEDVPFEYVRDDAPMNLCGYKFEHWIPKRMFLSEIGREARELNGSHLPLEYVSSFMQIITESSTDSPYISEKVCTPLFMRKPFLAIGSVGFHALLNTYGFQSYDELFDYSYDAEEELSVRVEMLVKECEKVCRMTSTEMTRMQQLLKPKLEFNFNLACELATDISIIPPIILELHAAKEWHCPFGVPILNKILEKNARSPDNINIINI